MTDSRIPESLVERVRAGRAALVVGSNIGALAGMPSWKKVLERLVSELEKRGKPGDKEAADDVATLLKKGRIVNAAGFLARTLGGDFCDSLLKQLWKTPEPISEAIKVLGRIPMRAVWTVHPGDLVERAIESGSPDGWSDPRVGTYKNAGEIDTRRRYVLKLLGDLATDTYVVVATSIRRAFAGADDYRKILRDLYEDGSLVLVGFRHGDPDLDAVLERVFGGFEPTSAEHFFVGSGLSPVDIEELQAEHHMTCINLDGAGGDQVSTDALAAWLADLAKECEKAGINLKVTRPGADDLEGWHAILTNEAADAEALAALAAMEQTARDGKQSDRLVEVLLVRVEVEPDARARAAILREVAGIYEKEIGDLPRAFTALTTALCEDPADEQTVVDAERLADETDGWGELVGDLSQVVPQIEDKRLAAAHWVRLGRWYHEKLRHYDYALASYREALKLDPRRRDARYGLEELYRKQQRWGELAEEILAHVEIEPDTEKRVELLLALGDLHETQLASTAKAVDSYEKALALDPDNAEVLSASERLYRRTERWGKLVGILEKRAELLEKDDPGQAAALRKELGTLRSDKLGDLEGAIGRYESALASNDKDLDALRALEKLYEKVGRTDDYLRTLERLAEAGPESERAPAYRRLAAEVEDREGGVPRAIGYYERVIEVEPNAMDAFRSLERLHRTVSDWDGLVRLHERHLGAIAGASQRRDVYLALGRVWENELQDPHKAIEPYESALSLSEGDLARDPLTALARLYKRVETWDKAVESLLKLGELAGERGAPHWFEAGEIAAKHVGDPVSAENRFAKALELDAHHLPSMLALVELYRKRRDWAKAAQLMVEAERRTQNRLEKINLLYSAALMSEEFLEQAERAAELYARVLQLDPEHIDAGQRVIEHWMRQDRWADAEPVLEMLARKVEDGDKVEKARREALVGRAAEALGKPEKAEKHYRLAVEADAESLDATLGLANLLYSRKEWGEAEQRMREALVKHRPSLAEGQVVELWHKVGTAARQRGDAKTAEDAFRRAIERDAGHRPSLLQLIELATARQDWRTVLEAKRSSLEGASEDERFRLLEEIGDLYAQRVQEPMTALGIYLEALNLRPRSHVVLHKMLEIYTEQKDWRRAIDTLDKLAEQEKDAARRAKYHYAAAVIARDELAVHEEAVDRFTHALDDAPTLPKAFDAIEKILGERGDWKGLARAYKTMIQRLGDRATDAQILPLWTRLGDVARDRLGDREAAITAYEVAAALEPGNLERHESLAKLYLAAGPERADKAIVELQILLKKYPDRLDLYRDLARLYAETGQLDKAYCLASALVFLGQANDADKKRFETGRAAKLPLAKRRLTEELWQKSIIHPREDRALNAIFASLMASLAATTAQPHQALNLNPKEQADPERDPHLVARIFRYAVHTLGIDPQPELYLREGSREGIRAANIAERGVLQPAVLIGEPHVGRRAERDLAFDVAKKLSFFRPERYVFYALPTLPKLEAAVSATLHATGHANGKTGKASPETQKLVDHIQKTVPKTVLEQVGSLAGRLAVREGEAAVKSWLTATDLTANRVGLILSNDLETAARIVATEQGAPSTLSAKDRLRELLAYACSEEYFLVRRHLGLEVQ
jgi:golgin subfamily B member 1